jgi:hypothetical protein
MEIRLADARPDWISLNPESKKTFQLLDFSLKTAGSNVDPFWI